MEKSTYSFYIETTWTARQLQVLDLIADGFTNDEIGKKLFMSKRTAEVIRAILLLKTGSRNAASLVAFGFRHGILK